MTDVILVTAESHPALFAAFELISHDVGRQAGHRNYAVPLVWEDRLPAVETQLARLHKTAPGEFALCCIGEMDEMALVVKRWGLQDVDELLQQFSTEFS